MKIAKDMVVALNFTLTDDQGEIIDSSEGEPLSYLHGYGELVPGLEKALLGHAVGDSLKVTVDPEEGYGTVVSDLLIEVERSELPDDMEPELGLELTCDGPDGEAVSMWIVDITDEGVKLDGNHPLAGLTLHFEVDVAAIRHAEPEEIAHGHVHGDEHEHGEEADSTPYTH